MKTTTSFAPTKFVSKIGMHHFAHLRCIAEGVDSGESALRYLGVEHGNEAITASRQTIEAVRAVARRAGEKEWRLIGLSIRPKVMSAVEASCAKQGGKATAQPTFEEFVAERDLDDWREAEVLEMYNDAYPPALADKSLQQRRSLLRERQTELLRRLETISVEQPDETHPVNGWFDSVTSLRLVKVGIMNIGQLCDAIRIGGRWYANMQGVGKGKVKRIIDFLHTIMPNALVLKPNAYTFALVDPSLTPFRMIDQGKQAQDTVATVSIPTISNAASDLDAVKAWVKARAGSIKTATVYVREGVRLILWLQKERSHKRLSCFDSGDCGDYMAFLQRIPTHWISRRKAAPYSDSWAPFRGQLSHDSQKQTIVIVSAMFHWLQSAGYLQSNPWLLINKKTGDDKNQLVKKSKAISEFSFSEILKYIKAQPVTASSERMLFVFTFLEAVGLRSSELLSARLEHFEHQEEGWVLYISGKGSKNRFVFIAKQAFDAVQRYLTFRNVGSIESATPSLPLIASVKNPTASIGYQSLYESVKLWISHAINSSELSAKEKDHLRKGTPHWLRHTFGTRSVARNVAMDAIQAQMGHSSIQTTMDIYGRAPMKRRADEIAKAFG